MDRKTLIIIGGGIAGISAAHAARSRYPDSRIIVLSGEKDPFYNRIALNSYICGKTRKDHMGFYPLGDLDSRNIDFRSRCRISTIHPEDRYVEAADGERFNYDSLIIATGAEAGRPEIPGTQLANVYSLWTLEDAARIRGAMETAGRVFVLGAGVLGVEIALALQDSGKDVTLAARGEWVMPRLLGQNAGRLYSQLLESKGVRVLTNAGVKAIDGAVVDPTASGSHRLQLHFLDGSSDEADVVLTLTGARPQADPAARAGLAVGSGIIVNEYMETSQPGILACGNCIEPVDSSGLLWNPAMIQGRTAGRNAFELTSPLPDMPDTIHIKAPEIPAYIGGQRPLDADRARTEGRQVLESREPGAHRILEIDRDGCIRSACFIGRTDGAYDIEQAIVSKKTLPPNILAGGSIDGVIDYLKRPVLTELYPGRAWVCRMCGYIYEGDDPPEICPVCSVGKDQFQAA